MVRLLPAVPRPLVRRLSSRYIAGPTLADAMRTVASLNAAGKLATVDVLGEEITQPEEAEAIAQAYLDALAAIETEGLDSNVSVKLTGLGLKLDRDLCRANLEAVVRDAAARHTFVRIDMEDSSTTDDTLRLYRDLREAVLLDCAPPLVDEVVVVGRDRHARADPEERVEGADEVRPDGVEPPERDRLGLDVDALAEPNPRA